MSDSNTPSQIITLPRSGRLTADQIVDYNRPAYRKEAGRNLMDASRQWAQRPPDERYLSPEDLLDGVEARRQFSDEFPGVYVAADSHGYKGMEVNFVEEGPLAGNLYAVSYGDYPAIFTNWSMNQSNSTIGGPNIGWLRQMPAPVARVAMNSSIKYSGKIDASTQVKLLAAPPQGDAPGLLRAVTSPTYGRIWDADVVRTVILINEDGRWVVPGKVAGRGMADQYTEVTKQSTTLYASDRDVWMFLVDEQHPVEVDGELYFRGFIVSNSEVGNATFSLKTFLLKQVCMNRIIWGAIQVRELRIRHSRLAPTKFLQGAVPALAAYSTASVAGVQNAIAAAKKVSIAHDLKGAQDFLRDQGFGVFESSVIPVLAEKAEDVGSNGDPTNLYDVVMAGTAYARELVHADARVAFEQKVGGLLDRFAKVR